MSLSRGRKRRRPRRPGRGREKRKDPIGSKAHNEMTRSDTNKVGEIEVTVTSKLHAKAERTNKQKRKDRIQWRLRWPASPTVETSISIHQPRLCRFEVFLIQTNVHLMFIRQHLKRCRRRHYRSILRRDTSCTSVSMYMSIKATGVLPAARGQQGARKSLV